MALSFLSGFRDVLDQYDGYLVDLWGVVHDGYQTYEGTLDLLETLRDSGKQVIFLSNAPRRSSLVAHQLTKLSVDESLYTNLYTSGEDAFLTLMKKQGPYEAYGPTVYALSAEMHMPLYDELPFQRCDRVEEADFLMNTGPQMTSVEAYQDVLDIALDRGLPMICVNPDISVVTGGKVVLCAGALATHYESMGGEVRYHGKPYPAVYDNALALFQGIPAARILAVGDSLKTDIKGANGAGLDSALVMTGLHRRHILNPGENPQLQAEKEHFSKTCNTHEIYPTYIVGGFRL